MNIAVFFTYENSLKTWNDNGTLNRELKLFQILNQKYDLNFTLVTYGDENDLNFISTLEGFRVLPIYSKYSYSSNRIFRFLNSITIAYKLKKELADVDILYQNQLLGSWVPIILKIILKKPFLARTGYDMLDFAIQDSKNKYIIFLYKLLTYITIYFSDLFYLSSNTDFRRFVSKYKKFHKKFKLRSNWAAVDKLFESERKFKRIILTVGRLVYQKNYIYLIDELSGFKNNIEVNFIGEGEYKNKLIDYSKEKNVLSKFLGSMPHEDLNKAYKNYTFFISTSLYEGNPKTVLEAMASGCIVIASNISNHSEIIEDGINGYLFELKKNGLFERLFEIINKDDTELNKIRLNSLNHIEKNFSIENLAKNMYLDFQILNLKSG